MAILTIPIAPPVREVPKDEQISKYFKLTEFFRTKHDEALLWEEFCKLSLTVRGVYFENLVAVAKQLDEVREHYGKPIVITSGWRSPRVNNASGGAPKSYHLVAMAADIIVSGVPASKVQADWDKKWKGGLGYGNGFTHLDIRHETVRFDYK